MAIEWLLNGKVEAWIELIFFLEILNNKSWPNSRSIFNRISDVFYHFRNVSRTLVLTISSTHMLQSFFNRLNQFVKLNQYISSLVFWCRCLKKTKKGEIKKTANWFRHFNTNQLEKVSNQFVNICTKFVICLFRILRTHETMLSGSQLYYATRKKNQMTMVNSCGLADRTKSFSTYVWE